MAQYPGIKFFLVPFILDVKFERSTEDLFCYSMKVVTRCLLPIHMSLLLSPPLLWLCESSLCNERLKLTWVEGWLPSWMLGWKLPWNICTTCGMGLPASTPASSSGVSPPLTTSAISHCISLPHIATATVTTTGATCAWTAGTAFQISLCSKTNPQYFFQTLHQI